MDRVWDGVWRDGVLGVGAKEGGRETHFDWVAGRARVKRCVWEGVGRGRYRMEERLEESHRVGLLSPEGIKVRLSPPSSSTLSSASTVAVKTEKITEWRIAVSGISSVIEMSTSPRGRGEV